MNTLSYSTIRSNLATVLDKVNDDHEPVLVTRENGKTVVILSLEDYNTFKETACLKLSSANSKRLNQRIVKSLVFPNTLGVLLNDITDENKHEETDFSLLKNSLMTP